MMIAHVLCSYTCNIEKKNTKNRREGIKPSHLKCPLKLQCLHPFSQSKISLLLNVAIQLIVFSASGTPQTTVFWIGVASGQRTNSSVLEFTNISRSEAGVYRCEASNECGSAVEAVNITVQCE